MPPFSHRHRDALALLSLALLALIVFWPLFGGRASFFGDLELYFYPLGQFWHRELVQGRIPLWNPYLFGGVPFAGNPQMGLLYPPSALLAIFPTIPALMLGAVLHLWGSAALFFGWLRRGRPQLGAMAALLGAMVWMLGGFFVSKTQFPNMLAALAWVPAALWSAENLARTPALRRAVILGAVLGLQLLAAHAQISLYTIYFALIYALWSWKTTPQRASFPRLAAFFGGALVLAALLDAGQLFPVVENLRGAVRQTLSIQTAPRFFLPPWALSNLFAPYFYGNPMHGTWTGLGGGNFWETACYVGIVPFGLALWGFRRAKFWCAVALASLLLALGPMGGLYLAAFSLVPGVARFHDAGRFLIGAAVAFALAAALGVQGLRNGAKTRPLVPFLLLLSALDLGIFARGVYPLRPASQIAPVNALRADAMLEAQQGRVWCPDRFAAGRLFVRYEDYRFRTPQHDARWASVAQPNLPVWHRHLEASGYDPIAPRRALERLETLHIAPNAAQFPPDYAARLGADSVRVFSLWRAAPMPPAPGLTEIYRSAQRFEGRQFFLYRNDKCLPRARFSSQKSGWEAAKITSASANVVEIETPPGARQVELADNFAPSWSAFQNGQKLEIRATERGFRAVNLESRAQSSRVRFVYAPTSFRLGVFLSLCALSLIIATLMAQTKKPETK